MSKELVALTQDKNLKDGIVFTGVDLILTYKGLNSFILSLRDRGYTVRWEIDFKKCGLVVTKTGQKVPSAIIYFNKVAKPKLVEGTEDYEYLFANSSITIINDKIALCFMSLVLNVRGSADLLFRASNLSVSIIKGEVETMNYSPETIRASLKTLEMEIDYALMELHEAITNREVDKKAVLTSRLSSYQAKKKRLEEDLKREGLSKV